MISIDRRWLVGMAVGALILGGWAFAFRSPPQMGASDQVFNTVDALYTAVRNEDTPRVVACERRLLAASEAGVLPPAAWAYLGGVIDTAKAGRWRPAAESLYEFMKVQRRDGPISHAADHDTRKAKPVKRKAG